MCILKHNFGFRDDDGNPVEAYQPQKVLDPLDQHFNDVVARKALQGGKKAANKSNMFLSLTLTNFISLLFLPQTCLSAALT